MQKLDTKKNATLVSVSQVKCRMG